MRQRGVRIEPVQHLTEQCYAEPPSKYQSISFFQILQHTHGRHQTLIQCSVQSAYMSMASANPTSIQQRRLFPGQQTVLWIPAQAPVPHMLSKLAPTRRELHTSQGATSRHPCGAANEARCRFQCKTERHMSTCVQVNISPHSRKARCLQSTTCREAVPYHNA